jgi:flagellar hook protein FlgE
MTFQTALSGLAAATADIRVTSNNIANANTTAFKSSRAEFADLFTGDPAQLGAGVRLAGIRQDFTQGNIDTTERQLDLAIKGRGFFVLSSDEGRSFSRAGAFGVTATGFVENAEARRLQVYPALATGGFNQGTLADLQIQSSTSPPVASTSVDMVVNLPATAVPPAAAPFDPTDPDTYNHSTSTVVFDSLGVAHTATYFFARTAGGWNVATTIDGAAVGTPQALTFTSTGQLATPAGGSVAFGPFTPGNGADPLDVSLDLDRTTQFGGNFSVASITPDGQTDRPRRLQQRRGADPGRRLVVPGNARLRRADLRRGHGIDLRLGPVGRPRGLERRPGGAARADDHRPARLPGQRPGDLGGRRDHPDHHQRPVTGRPGHSGRSNRWTA